jgi:serine/threonine protein phosphatase PrpC
MRLTAAGCTEAGPRPLNQDAYFVDLTLGLLIVADGMGGHKAGEVASRMAIEAVVEFIRETGESGELTWPFAFDPARSMAVNRLTVALRIANARVHSAGARDNNQAGMGTTIVAGLVDGARLTIGHVGDSRAYRLRGRRLQQMTQDDTWANALRAAGANGSIAEHPMRHVLTNGIGMRADLTLAVAEEPLVLGEHWLICTDGVHSYLDQGALDRSFDAASAEAAAQLAVQSALLAGTSDNATAVVLCVN